MYFPRYSRYDTRNSHVSLLMFLASVGKKRIAETRSKDLRLDIAHTYRMFIVTIIDTSSVCINLGVLSLSLFHSLDIHPEVHRRYWEKSRANVYSTPQLKPDYADKKEREREREKRRYSERLNICRRCLHGRVSVCRSFLFFWLRSGRMFKERERKRERGSRWRGKLDFQGRRKPTTRTTRRGRERWASCSYYAIPLVSNA